MCAHEQGLAPSAAVPKLVLISPPATHSVAGGRILHRTDCQLVVRMLSMGKFHHAITGTGAIGLAAAAAIPGTVVSQVLGGPGSRVTVGHPSGVVTVGAQASLQPRPRAPLPSVAQASTADTDAEWSVDSIQLSRCARRLMVGQVLVPSPRL